MEKTKKNFRESMSRLTGAVSIVKTEVDNREWGLTISSCTSISMDPPLLMVSLASNVTSAHSIEKSKKFSVYILNKQQKDLAIFGSQASTSKFLDEFIKTSNDQTNILKDSLAKIDCSLYKSVPAGDHTMFLGLVENVELGELKNPLVYFDRGFNTISV